MSTNVTFAGTVLELLGHLMTGTRFSVTDGRNPSDIRILTLSTQGILVKPTKSEAPLAEMREQITWRFVVTVHPSNTQNVLSFQCDVTYNPVTDNETVRGPNTKIQPRVIVLDLG